MTFSASVFFGQAFTVAWSFSSCGTWTQLPHGMWDLSSLIRVRTHVFCIERQILNSWTTRGVPQLLKDFLFYFGAQPINNVLIVSGAQQSDSACQHAATWIHSPPKTLSTQLAPSPLSSAQLLSIQPNLMQCKKTEFTVAQVYPAQYKSAGPRLAVLLLLLLSLFSRVRLCATPYTADHQAPPSLGFSRQEHWSGLPFPSPMQESKK